MMPNQPDTIQAKRIEEFIKSLGESELKYINRLVVERLKLIAQEKSTSQMMRFNVGERVVFHDNGGIPLVGCIAKLNKKTATVITDTGHHWNVSPALLSHEE